MKLLIRPLGWDAWREINEDVEDYFFDASGRWLIVNLANGDTRWFRAEHIGELHAHANDAEQE